MKISIAKEILILHQGGEVISPHVEIYYKATGTETAGVGMIAGVRTNGAN